MGPVKRGKDVCVVLSALIWKRESDGDTGPMILICEDRVDRQRGDR